MLRGTRCGGKNAGGPTNGFCANEPKASGSVQTQLALRGNADRTEGPIV
jgi:hypothetical protein